jgi:hypothetical protein
VLVDFSEPTPTSLSQPVFEDAEMTSFADLPLNLLNDEAGFVVSAELVMISTVLVLGLVVGLAEVANGVNQELEDVASAFGSVNQTFRFSGLTGHKGFIVGSAFGDKSDYCDSQFDINCDGGASPEAGSGYGGGYDR